MDAIRANIEYLSYRSNPAFCLHDISLSVGAGEFVVVIGEGGGGKTSLLHAVSGAAPKFYQAELRGKIELLGEDIADMPLTRISERLGYMTEEPTGGIVAPRVLDNAAFGLCNLNLPSGDVISRAERMLELMGLTELSSRSSAELSGGQTQRMVLAGILAREAPILLLDQPAAELDADSRHELYGYLRRINRERGVSILMTASTAEALPYADRVLVMEGGTIRQSLQSRDYLRERKAVTLHRRQAALGEVVLRAKALGYSYRGGVGCRDISFELRAGEVCTLCGQNGSGKSTLLRLLAGLLPAGAGKIELFGNAVTKKNIASLRQRMGFVFQNPDWSLLSDTVYAELMYSLRHKKLSEKEADAKIRAAAEAFGLTEYLDANPQLLSRSRRQLLAIAAAVVTEPKLLLCDEPTSGLSEAEGVMVMNCFRELTANGSCVLMVTHEPRLAGLSDRLMLLKEHELLFDSARSDRERGEILRRLGESEVYNAN